MKAASQPIMKDEEFVEFANAYFQGEIDKHQKKAG